MFDSNHSHRRRAVGAACAVTVAIACALLAGATARSRAPAVHKAANPDPGALATASGTSAASPGPVPEHVMTSQPPVDPGGGLAVTEPPKRLPRHAIQRGSGPAAAVVVGSFSANGIPAVALAAYRRATNAADRADRSCHLGWTLLAGIGRVESDHGQFGGAQLLADGLSTIPVIGPPLNGKGTALIRDTDNGRLDGDRTFDRAVGPMQFIPSTWAVWASDGDHDGQANPFDINDASLAAARYLCAAGGDLATHAGKVRAVLAYNHSMNYVHLVLAYAALYAGLDPGVIPSLPPAAPRPIGPTSTRGPQPPSTTRPARPGPTRHPTRGPSHSTHPAAPTTTRSSPSRVPSTSSTHPTTGTSSTRPVKTSSARTTTTVVSSPVTSTAGTPVCPTPTGTRTRSTSTAASTTGATSTSVSSSAASMSDSSSRPRHSQSASSSSAACGTATSAEPKTVSAGVTGITGLVAFAFALLAGVTLVRRRLGGVARH
jgi:membrane-bound lytic murein transglycosylase B